MMIGFLKAENYISMIGDYDHSLWFTHLGGVEKEWFKLDFLGRRVSHKITHKPSTGSALSEVITQTYDTWDLPLVTKHKRGSGTAVTIASRTYDKAGRLKTLTRNGMALQEMLVI